MQIVERLLGDVLVISTTRHVDGRGTFAVPYEVEAATGLGLPASFHQDNHLTSRHVLTLRGIHLQLPPFAQGKLVRVLKGEIFDAFVDLRPGSSTFGQHGTVELCAELGTQLWIPAGFGHGVLTRTPDTEIFYKVDAPYRPTAERVLAWNDPAVGIDWPLAGDRPTLSSKDREGLDFASLATEINGHLRVETKHSDPVITDNPPQGSPAGSLRGRPFPTERTL